MAVARSEPSTNSRPKLTFLHNTGSIASLRRLTRTRSSATISSDASPYGPGSDLGRFLNWLGERMLDAYVDLVIRSRLTSIRRLLARSRTLALVQPASIRRACEDLVVLCECAALISVCSYRLLMRKTNLSWLARSSTRELVGTHCR